MAHVDRDRSKAAIKELIAAEEEKIKGLEKRKKKRQAEGLPFDDLDNQIEGERQSIKGKETILDIVDEFGQAGSVDAEIKAEQELLKDGKKALEELRRREPRPRKEIDELARNVERLEKRIAGKNKAKDALVSD